MRRTQPGFTLIEALAAVTVIALLLMILLPTLRTAIEKARTLTCAHRLHTLVSAQTLYTIDHGGLFSTARTWCANSVWYGTPETTFRNPANLQYGLYPYVGNEGIYLCSTFRSIVAQGITYASGVTPVRSYTMTWTIAPAFSSPDGRTAYDRLYLIKNASLFAVFTEEDPYIVPGRDGYSINDGYWRANGTASTPGADAAGTYHMPPATILVPGGYMGCLSWGSYGFGSANVGFLDGHTELIPYNFGNPYGYLPDYKSIVQN